MTDADRRKHDHHPAHFGGGASYDLGWFRCIDASTRRTRPSCSPVGLRRDTACDSVLIGKVVAGKVVAGGGARPAARCEAGALMAP